MNNLSDLIEDEYTQTQLKVLILEMFGEALVESTSVEEMGKKFRQKVLSL